MPDSPLPADCLSELHPLTEESACDLWAEFICPSARHPMQLPAEAWPVRLYSSDMTANWQEDWNDDSAIVFRDWLGGTLPWAPDTPVVFTWSAARSVATSWKIFLRCWRHFLVDDEGPFLWSLSHAEAIAFTPRGLAYAGRRSTPECST